MHNLGVLSAEGVDGKPDYATAVSWFRKAADFGLRDSQYNLAILYARGMGVDKNLPTSWAWFTAAAGQGDADSAQKREDIAARLTPNQMAAARTMVEAYRPRTADPVINDVAAPAGGWDAVTVTNTPKPATPAPKAKVSKL
jgi:localization factor PodJL